MNLPWEQRDGPELRRDTSRRPQIAVWHFGRGENDLLWHFKAEVSGKDSALMSEWSVSATAADVRRRTELTPPVQSIIKNKERLLVLKYLFVVNVSSKEVWWQAFLTVLFWGESDILIFCICCLKKFFIFVLPAATGSGWKSALRNGAPLQEVAFMHSRFNMLLGPYEERLQLLLLRSVKHLP